MNTETKQQKEKQKKIKTNSRKKQKNRKKIFVGSEDTNKMCRKKNSIAENNAQEKD